MRKKTCNKKFILYKSTHSSSKHKFSTGLCTINCTINMNCKPIFHNFAVHPISLSLRNFETKPMSKMDKKPKSDGKFGNKYMHTLSMGSTEWPFKSLWFSSLFQSSLSLLLTGSKRDAPVLDRSGISAIPRNQGFSTRCERDTSDDRRYRSFRKHHWPGRFLSTKKTTRLTVYLQPKHCIN